MAEKEQVKPLAPLAYQIRSDVEEDYQALSEKMKLRETSYLLCFGCVTAFLLIVAVVFIVLAFTVLHVQNPRVHLISVSVQGLKLTDGPLQSSSSNITLLSTLSIRNANIASFKFSDSTTTLYYAGTVVGEGIGPPGTAKARRTEIMNVTSYLMAEKIRRVTRFESDLKVGALNISSHTLISGKVKIMKKKKVTVEMNCTMTYNISSQAIQDHYCDGHLHF